MSGRLVRRSIPDQQIITHINRRERDDGDDQTLPQDREYFLFASHYPSLRVAADTMARNRLPIIDESVSGDQVFQSYLKLSAAGVSGTLGSVRHRRSTCCAPDIR
jgi:hypothetical protein